MSGVANQIHRILQTKYIVCCIPNTYGVAKQIQWLFQNKYVGFGKPNTLGIANQIHRVLKTKYIVLEIKFIISKLSLKDSPLNFLLRICVNYLLLRYKQNIAAISFQSQKRVELENYRIAEFILRTSSVISR